MNSKSDIYFLTFNDLPYDQRMLRIWSTLSEAGYSIHITGRNLTGDLVPVFPYTVKRFSPWFKKSWLAYAEFNVRAFLLLLSKRPAVISSVDLDTLPAAVLYRRLFGGKLIFDAHEYFSELPELADSPLKKYFWEWMAKQCIPKTDLRYTVSDNYAGLMSSRYKVSFEVVRNMPYASFQDKSSKFTAGTTRNIMYQGVLNEGRGLENLILSTKDIEGVHLTLIGKGDKEMVLKKMVTDMNLHGKVTFAGHVLPGQLQALTRTAWLGVNILENKGLSYYYSLANKFFDYMQAGVVQLCIDFPEYRKVNDRYQVAHLIEDIEVETIRKGIEYLLANADVYNGLQKNIAVAAKELTWENETEKLLAIYQQ